jgi:aryl sulfotransferase
MTSERLEGSPAPCVYRTWILDSRRWSSYRPRPDDIVIATYPKCGTTWMQRIVALLVFQTIEPRPVMDISPWIERRFPEPIEAVAARLEAQAHRRFLKTHLPFDGLPVFDRVKYIHVARDGRDACMSYHNHILALTPAMLDALDEAGLQDETIARPYPRASADPAQHFHRWLAEGAVPGHDDGAPMMSYFHFERSWWQARHRANVLLVHYNDLKLDLPGEMRRVADFLDIRIAPDLLPGLAEAAGFEAMRRDGDVLMGRTGGIFQGGAGRFFHMGTNERWRGHFRAEDLALYDAKLQARLPVGCARWVSGGRSKAGDPATC